MAKRMSDKQLAANRTNAQKSTGPQTDEGKAVSKMNATKHGILSREVIVRGLISKESEREFLAFHRRFREHLAPVGPLEEMLVDQIVTTQWRLRRVLRAEAGEVALSMDGGYWKRSKRNPAFTVMEWTALGDPIHAMQDSVVGLDIMISWLEKIRVSLDKENELTEQAVRSVFVNGKSNSLSEKLNELRAWFLNNPEGLGETALLTKHKEQVLAFVDQRLKSARWRRRDCSEYETREEFARQDAASLPSKEALDKIMRYETKLYNQLARAMAQLERLQRMRSGEAVPPPLSVNFSERE